LPRLEVVFACGFGFSSGDHHLAVLVLRQLIKFHHNNHPVLRGEHAIFFKKDSLSASKLTISGKFMLSYYWK
jgi:hypothetical protein